MKYRAGRVILLGGLLCGIFDIAAAFTIAGLRGRSPVRVLQSIASGLLGADAYKGNWSIAGLGGFLHFFIALGAAAVYYGLSRIFPSLFKIPVACGLLYGIAVYGFMNLVVLPLSAFPHKMSFPPQALLIGLTIHMCCVGLPIALAVHHSGKKERPELV